MRVREKLFDRWRTDYDFKTIVTSFGSLVVTIAFAWYNGFLGIYHSSLWHGTISVYYLVLAVLRGFTIWSEKKLSRREDGERSRKKIYILSALLLLILNVSLIVPEAVPLKRRE